MRAPEKDGRFTPDTSRSGHERFDRRAFRRGFDYGWKTKKAGDECVQFNAKTKR